jgi:hypothetical protein
LKFSTESAVASARARSSSRSISFSLAQKSTSFARCFAAASVECFAAWRARLTSEILSWLAFRRAPSSVTFAYQHGDSMHRALDM